MKKSKHVFWETFLIIGSVFVFRSLWLLMDEIPVLSQRQVLGVFLVIGLIMTGVGYYRIVHAH